MTYYQICLGDYCHKIMKLPYKNYKNIKYCSACRDKIRDKRERERQRIKRKHFYD